MLAKLLIDVLASIVLLLFVQRLGSARHIGGGAPLLHGAITLVLLVVATVLSVYRPRGLTPYGWRRLRERRAAALRRRQPAAR